MSRIGLARRKFIANFWTIAVGAVVGALLSVSFCMLVKAEILYGLADSLGVARGTLNAAANALGVAGLVVGIPSVVACFVGGVLRKY